MVENSKDNTNKEKTHFEKPIDDFNIKKQKPKESDISSEEAQKILDLIFEKGLDEAMQLYKK